MPQIIPETLTTFATDLLQGGGATLNEAQIVGASLIDANMKGYDSHGVMRIPFYLDMLTAGDIISGAPLETINENGGIS